MRILAASRNREKRRRGCARVRAGCSASMRTTASTLSSRGAKRGGIRTSRPSRGFEWSVQIPRCARDDNGAFGRDEGDDGYERPACTRAFPRAPASPLFLSDERSKQRGLGSHPRASDRSGSFVPITAFVAPDQVRRRSSRRRPIRRYPQFSDVILNPASFRMSGATSLARAPNDPRRSAQFPRESASPLLTGSRPRKPRSPTPDPRPQDLIPAAAAPPRVGRQAPRAPRRAPR